MNLLLLALRPLGYAWLLCRKVARRVCLATVGDLVLFKRTGRRRYRIESCKRKSFVMIGDSRLRHSGKATAVDYEIPEEISKDAAWMLLCAQTIDPWFADRLFGEWLWRRFIR